MHPHASFVKGDPLGGEWAAHLPVCVALTFDHLGVALDIGRLRASRPDPAHPSITLAIPRIIRLLSMIDAHATFFVEGWNLLHHPGVLEDLAGRGHDVALHGWLHEVWSDTPRSIRERAISDSLVLAEHLGLTIQGFRPPGGKPGTDDVSLLATMGFAYSSSLLDEHDGVIPELGGLPTAPSVSDGVVDIPFRWNSVDQWHHKFRQPPEKRLGAITSIWLENIFTASPGSLVVLVLHPFACAVADERFEQTELFLQALADNPRVRFVRCNDIASKNMAPPSAHEASSKVIGNK